MKAPNRAPHFISGNASDCHRRPAENHLGFSPLPSHRQSRHDVVQENGFSHKSRCVSGEQRERVCLKARRPPASSSGFRGSLSAMWKSPMWRPWGISYWLYFLQNNGAEALDRDGEANPPPPPSSRGPPASQLATPPLLGWDNNGGPCIPQRPH